MNLNDRIQSNLGSFESLGNQGYTQKGDRLLVWHQIVKRKASLNTITIPAQSVPVTGGGGGTVNIPAQVVPGPEQSQIELFTPFFVLPTNRVLGLDPFASTDSPTMPSLTLINAVGILSPTLGTPPYIDQFAPLQIRVHSVDDVLWGSSTVPGGDLMASVELLGPLANIPKPFTLVGNVTDWENAKPNVQRRNVEPGERVGVYPDLEGYSPSEIEFDVVTVGLYFAIN